MDKRLSTWLTLADKNLAESLINRAKNTNKGELYETENYIIYTIGVDVEDAHLNGALCFDDNYSEEMIKKADEFFEIRNRNYVVWVRDHADCNLERILKERELSPKREPGSAGMIINEKIHKVEIPDGFCVKQVTTLKEVEDFSKVIQSAFEMKPDVAKEMFSSSKILYSSNVISFVMYDKEKPVAAASTVMSNGIAGIYWVGTVEEAQGKGLGSYIAQTATNAGFEAGAKAVILQASAAGEKVYRRLGYETITHYRGYPVEL
jgi:ribosomal protein S18 acetylase RimI-like enzyme